MAAQIRVLRRRIRSTQSIKKITRAMELIATSRIVKARARVLESRPYAEQITAVLTELASNSALDHPLLVEKENPRRAAVLVVTSDRGQAGGYNNNVLKEAEAPLLAAARGGQGAGHLRDRAQGRELLPVPQARGQRVVDRLLRAAHLRRMRPRRRACSSRRSWPMTTTRTASTSCISCTRSSRTWSRRCPQARRMAPMVVEYVEDEPSGGHPAAVRVRARRRRAVRRAAAQVHRCAAVLGAAGVRGLGVGQPPARDEGGDRQCERADP